MRKPVTQKSRSASPQPASQPARKSVSRQMYERFEKRKVWRHSMAVVYVAVMTAYLCWRWTIINPDSMALSAAYFTADCIGFILGITSILASWNYRHRDPLPAPVELSVDVFLPTYKEPLHIIRRTALAAKAIRYPHGTVILDDGRRDEVRALADELGIRYLRRPENFCAKAGNLNYGLAHSRADFVMVFDADHIALPHALDVTLGFFSDDKVAIVQTPQDYYNTDAFQYFSSGRTGGLWHDQSFFYNVVQPSADATNSASCVGTGVVYRRAALNHIGGIPVDTVTEDIHTSLKLHKAGFKGVFLNEPVAYGIAASDLTEYYKTRHRWANGNLHASAVENILFCKGLTAAQRFQYLALELQYLEGWQQLILFAVPLVALTFGLQPFMITIGNVLVVTSFPFLSYVLLQEIGCGFTRYWANEIFSMARWPIHIVSIAGLFGRKMVFSSSSKNIEGKVNWRLMMPQLSVIAAGFAAFGIGIYRLHQNYAPGPLFQFLSAAASSGSIQNVDMSTPLPSGYTIDLVAIAGFWAVYGAVRAAFFMRKAVKDARNSRAFFRFDIPMPVIIDAKGGYGQTSQLSEDWISFVDCRDGLRPVPGSMMDITLVMPAGPLRVKVAVENVKDRRVEGHLVFGSEDVRDSLANGLYSVDWHREFLHRNAYFMTPSDFVLKCIGLRRMETSDTGVWRAVLCHPKDEGAAPFYAIMAKKRNFPQAASFLTFQKLSVGDQVEGMVFTDEKMAGCRCIVTGTEPLASLVQKGLDGATPARYSVSLIA